MGQAELTYEHFSRYFPHAPTALCIKQCARLAVLKEFALDGPILDVGCGDGLFATVAFRDAEIWGIDIDGEEGRWAQASRAYSQVVLGDITKAKLPDTFFKSCTANCSLEHVPDIDAALRTIARSLEPGGRAYLFVPSKDWAAEFLTVRMLGALFGERAGTFLQNGIDEFFKHHHLYDEQGWREVIERSPMKLVEIRPVLSTATTRTFEAFLLPSLLGWANKKMTTRWTNFPLLRRLAAPVAYALAKGVLATSGDDEMTAEFLIVCERPA